MIKHNRSNYFINSIRQNDQPSHRAVNEIEAAEHLGLSVATLRAWRHRGKGPRFVRFGRAVRYLADDLTDFIDGCRIDTDRTSSANVGADEGAGPAS